MTEDEARLRDALAQTSLALPRPLSDLELPFKLDRLIAPLTMNSLRPAAVLAPVLRRGHDLSMLFTVRSAQLRSHSGQISFPGGRRDPEDADAVANALREAHEEVGLCPDCVEVLGYLDDYPTLSRYRITPVVGLVEGDPDLTVNPDEVAEVFEVPIKIILEPNSFERKILSRGGINLPFYELNWGPHRIWGATAGMLWDLAQKAARA